MNAQRIVTPAGERLVLLPDEEFEALREAAEDASDVAAFDDSQRKLASGEEELIPSEIVNRLLGGENPVRVWREHRGLSPHALAEKARLKLSDLEEIERASRDATARELRRLADVLSLTIDDLVS